MKSGGSFRPWSFVEQLSRRGHDVAVVTHTYGATQISLPEIRIHDPSFARQRRGLRGIQWTAFRGAVEVLNRIGVSESILSPWRSSVLRHAQEISQCFQPDVVLATYPPVEVFEAGLELARRWSVPLVADFRDGLIFEPIEHRRMKRYRCVRSRYRRIEEAVLQRAQAVIAAHPDHAEYLWQNGAAEKTTVLTNFFDRDELERIVPVEPESGTLNLVHAGAFAASDPACDIGVFIDAVGSVVADSKSTDRRLRIHQLGKLTRRERRLVRPLIERGVFIDHGVVPRARCLSVERSADVLLLINSRARPSVAPGKIFEYLGIGRPILALSEGTFAAEIVRETGGGWIIDPGDKAAIESRLRYLLSADSSEWGMIPNEAQVEKYSSACCIDELERLLNGLTPL